MTNWERTVDVVDFYVNHRFWFSLSRPLCLYNCRLKDRRSK